MRLIRLPRMIKAMARTQAASPMKTETTAETLCLTTSMSEAALSLGYLRLVNSPTKAAKVGKMIEARRRERICRIDTGKAQQKMRSQTRKIGTEMRLLMRILASRIWRGVTGRLLVMLKLLPSSEISEEVIDVMQAVKIIRL